MISLVHLALIELIEDYPHYFTLAFWDDLKKKGAVPICLPPLLASLWREPSELLRTIADYIDAYTARKGDRGARLQATEKLYDYAYQVKARGANQLNWRELKQKFCSYYEADENWHKFLRDRGIPFFGVGRPRSATVQNRKKNTDPPVCVRMTGDHKSRRDSNNAENGSRPRG